MKKVGKRKQPSITSKASGKLLARGCRLNDELHQLPTGNTTYFPRGVYHYKTHEAASNHWLQCVTSGIANQHKAR